VKVAAITAQAAVKIVAKERNPKQAFWKNLMN
jgi:hypothetical protein